MKATLLLPCVAILAAMSISTQDGPTKAGESKDFRAFTLRELAKEQKRTKRTYLQFLAEPTLSSGIYKLPKGGKDKQSPHGLDEVYYVIEGKAKFVAAGETVDAEAGGVLFVRAGVEHRFFDIEEDLTLLVFFSNKKPAAKPRPKKAKK